MGTWGYARLSIGRDSNREGLTNQANEILAYAKERGIALEPDQVLRETLPAYRRGEAVERPKFDALMRKAEQDPEAFTLICYNLDRLTRTLTDLDRIIKVADRGAHIYAVTGNLDLQGTFGVTAASLYVILRRQEVEDIRRRTKMRKKHAKEDGHYLGQGIRTFGYTDATAERVQDEDEAEILTEVFNRVMQGESWNSLAKELNERDVKPPNQPKEPAEGDEPKPPILWTRNNLSKTFLSPALYGYMQWRDEDGNMTEHKAPWHEHRIFNDNQREQLLEVRKHRRTYKQPVGLKHYLSGVMTCGRCTEPTPLVSMGSRKYACRKCQNAISKPDVEHIIDLLILERILAGDELPASEQDRPPLDLSDLEEELEKRQQAFDLELISELDLEGAQERIVHAMEQRREEYNLAAERFEVPEWLQGEKLLETWINGDPMKKRDIALRIFKRITVKPFVRSGQGRFQPNRLDMTFRVPPHTLADYVPKRTPKQPLRGSNITGVLLHPAHFRTSRETQKELLLRGIRG